MSIDQLIQAARARVSGRLPRDVDLDAVARQAEEEVADMVAERLQSAMEAAILGAQSILKSTSEQYIEGLYVKDDLTLGIRESAQHLEYGYGPYQMLEGLLNGPNAKTAKDGSRYNIIPIGEKPPADVKKAIESKASDLFEKGRQVKASAKTLKSMAEDMRSLLVRSSGAKTVSRQSSEPQIAVASDKQDAAEKWVHPGFQGVNQLEFINEQLRADLADGTVRILESVALRSRDVR